MLIEVGLAGLVGLTILWLVLRPLLAAPGASRLPPEAVDRGDPEETIRGRALLALKEIDFDRATGKLSDEDFQQLRSKYELAAIEALNACTGCGAQLRPESKFCSECGIRR